jgi:two-component system cell cycle response regulator CpdR
MGAGSKRSENGSGEMARILVVEYNDAMRSFLAEALERSEYDVRVAQDAETALSLITSQKFDLLLSDVNLPGEDGVSLAHRAVRLNPALRVIFVTGFAAKAALATELVAKNTRILTKPFVLSELIRQVGEMMKPPTGIAPHRQFSDTTSA